MLNKQPNIFYRIWCFFMDSKKGEKLYWEECNRHYIEENSGFAQKLITFSPHPGRLRWRHWWLTKKLINLKWKMRFKNIKPEALLKVVRVTPATTKGELISEYPMNKLN